MTNLALSPSGSNFDVHSPVAATAGATIFPGYDAATRQFRAMTLPAGGGGSLENLSTVLYWDGGTTVPLADQTGNIEAPFADAQDLVDAIPGSGFLLLGTPGYVQSVLDVPGAVSPLYIAGLTPNSPQFGSINVEDSAQLYLTNLSVGTINLGPGSPLTVVGPCGLSDIIGDSNNNVALYGALGLAGNILNYVGEIDCEQLNAFGFQFQADVTTGGPCTMIQCTVQGGITLTVGGDLNIDLQTLNRLRDAGATFAVTGNVIVLDAPTEKYAAFEVIGTEGEITRVTKAFSGAQPGDTFAVAVDDGPNTMLAGSPQCLVADQVVIPFFFSASETASVEARVTRFTVGEV